jgi:putative restriction endonuclease
VRDEDVRSSCWAALEVLSAQFGEAIPYAGGLDRGFAYRGQRVPFLNRQKGIYRAAAQRGPAALAVQTSAKSPYGDRLSEDGLVYAYRDGPVDQPDNRALRTAYELQVPVFYYFGTRPGWYRPFYPCFVEADDPAARAVVISFGRMVGPLDEREPVHLDERLERRYVVRQIRARLHQSRFRGLVLPAYSDRCAVCRLQEMRLLDAAHIVGDLEERGDAVVSNGLSLCSIHHRAFDEDLVGISPDYEVRVSSRLLEDEDGPMLELLKGFHGEALQVPRTVAQRPDRERLADRYERFLARAS